jgi:hypothetical protein
MRLVSFQPSRSVADTCLDLAAEGDTWALDGNREAPLITPIFPDLLRILCKDSAIEDCHFLRMSKINTPTLIAKLQLPDRLRTDSWWLTDDGAAEHEETVRKTAVALILIAGGLKEKTVDRNSRHPKRPEITLAR